MSDTMFDDDEVVPAPVELEKERVESEVIESESFESTEPEVGEEHEVKPVEKPWQKNKVPEHIPYDRFREVNEKKRVAEEKLAEYEAKLAAYESAQNKTKSIETVDELSNLLQGGEIDLSTYNREVIKLAQKEFRQELELEKERDRIVKIEKDIQDSFNDKVTKATDRYPDIKEAVEHLSQYANYIPAEVRYAMLTDDNVADVIYEIASDEELLKFVLTANPIDVHRKIARISAKYDKREEIIEERPAPVAFKPKVPVAPMPSRVPTTPGSSKRTYSAQEIDKNVSWKNWNQALKEGRLGDNMM